MDMQPHLELSKELWKKFLKKEDLAIDATCGNGHDTLFLSGLSSVVALDIQKLAIDNTKKLLESHEKTAELYLLSHEKIDELPLPKAPRLIVYNLGYLPKGDKAITTMTDTTLLSVKKSLTILAEGGALCITCYPGHAEGALEEKRLEEWAQTLPSDRWLVCHHKWVNRKGAPSLFWISQVVKNGL